MIRQLTILAICLIFTLSGCTNKEFYNSTQPKNNESECRKLHPTEYEKCISLGSKSYEEYEKERQEVIKK
ncbi:hypothetical protein H4J46_10030 [Colwellia sp. MB02u-6]|uniref:hypothetical protein n=1 Tax=Colwellia sp. MB02u-6 TaxID=2759824 RepID=UPI0015F5888A|nr:hypothetical protein [Colwellia sp. MB02u-6]MBA6328272.1 hypothetical protein [Colwellia sp. MB02u-6]